MAIEATQTVAKGRDVLPETMGRGHQEEDRIVVPIEPGKKKITKVVKKKNRLSQSKAYQLATRLIFA